MSLQHIRADRNVRPTRLYGQPEAGKSTDNKSHLQRILSMRARQWIAATTLVCLASAAGAFGAAKAKSVIPYNQTKEPNPAYSPQEAMAKMKLLPGFKVSLVAAEPDVVNPTSFTFDDQGRIWVTESVEYPRESAGPGRDRVKILESTKHEIGRAHV